jgi:NADPH-dependent 2,4-dienoyl-CoA reductase/sulfur reductase-like enzyme
MTSAADLASSYDLVVIGGGPAGLAAVSLAARAGVATVLFDENSGVGGQIYRGITSTPVTNRAILGEDYWAGEALANEAKASGALIVNGATVWSLDPERFVGVSIAGKARMIEAKRVIIATGSQERPFPIPGWTLPGVMTAGAAQTVLKAQGLLPDGRTVLAGTGPLMWLLAAQILRAGGKIAAILDTTPRRNLLRAAPHLPDFMLSPYFSKGLALLREVKAKVPVRRVASVAAVGDGKLREVVSDRGRMPADLLLLHQGVVPNVNLAMAAGIEHRWDDLQLCWSPVLDHDGSTSVERIAIAGDGAGIGGAGAAIVRGRIAARAAVEALSPAAAAKLAPMTTLRASLAQAERGRAFLDTLFRPARQFRVPSGDTIVCRCEEVSAKDILDAVAIGATGPNQLKAYRRTGMGPCQGRLCGLTVTELMAQARGKTPQEIGYYRLRAPVKPITLAELAAVPKTEADVQAVVRG